MSKTVHINSTAEFTSLLSSSRVVVTDFYADWCGPCKAIAPFYEKLSSQLSRPNQITFAKVNTDNQKQIAQSYNITALPTFMIFKNGRETQRIQGGNPRALEAAVKNLEGEASAADASGSGSGGDGWIGGTVAKGYSDITASVDQRGLDFLNLSGDAGNAKSVFASTRPTALAGKAKETDGKDYIESDTDEQLMLFVPFQSTLKLHGLHITSIPPADDDEVSRPKTVKLYTNRVNVLGFDEADSLEATQTFELAEDDWDAKTGTAKLELRFVKFQNVSSVVVFVVDGSGDGEKTRVDRLRLIGETGEKRTMGKLEKIGDEAGE